MALSKGINSYVLVEEATHYFENRFNSGIWGTTPYSQEAVLTTATGMLEQQVWIGNAAAPDSNLAWPRVGWFDDVTRGYSLSFDQSYAFPNTVESENDLPREIQMVREATYELSLHLLNNPDLLVSVTTVKDLKAGSINLAAIKNPARLPYAIRQLYVDLIVNGRGGRGWDGF